MEKILLENIGKLVPEISSACTKIGNYLGEVLNDAIDKAFEKVVEITTESPVSKF